RLLERLEGEVSPEDLFCTLPGVGEELAHRIHDTLHLETLEELEVAAHDGRLATVPGLGERRIHAIRADLEEVLRQSTRQRARQRRLREAGHDVPDNHPIDTPPVRLLLGIDAEYRRDAAAGKLRRIAPRRFNPTGEAWLPILHTERDGWPFTALFSNTARAHELGKTSDWVVLFYEREGHEDQSTVVTETHGKLKGRRVVRGREEECLRLALGEGDTS
ncbi:MAG: DNA-binding protein, partial [Akkermansiaceae bacterium]|nr:DNA-binding protein [Akkermansiaceae bacterium]